MGQVEFFGETLETHATVSDFARMELAEANLAISDDDPRSEMRAHAALLTFIEDVIKAEDQARFRQLARSNRAGIPDLQQIVVQVAEQAAGRPTGGSADSSDGPSDTAPRSESNAEGKVAELFPGRPDKQLGALRSRSA